jgi:hypothetical protein
MSLIQDDSEVPVHSHALGDACDSMTLTTTFLLQRVPWTVSSLDARKCSENGAVTWGPSILVEHVFRCGGEYTEEVKQKLLEMFP